uniref:HotDog ACOT-type domain-containing protein n=1 Tax=Chromera velia CCMP2878 TaxID=1169474 RepID=A0A0G4H9Z4_9ALVE|eukprot:Cvel_25541.t1-p1 / transcript=Cvel_25541.t1 / gene=Cvel_25541 / organism=Chromera_velia_CCMP2878 / gene_product=Acyl-coenzyme A thioesterase 10, mitochondrial, putative / transcript_product=Acyl-coenzyme A thioesterase 10, mitochondrial, putative / location=Cvel_scaffold2907:12348-16284(-) / protein_length=506 / sequence_SO=supercontig / SO=protein_coding / is_pseudo=false
MFGRLAGTCLSSAVRRSPKNLGLAVGMCARSARFLQGSWQLFSTSASLPAPSSIQRVHDERIIESIAPITDNILPAAREAWGSSLEARPSLSFCPDDKTGTASSSGGKGLKNGFLELTLPLARNPDLRDLFMRPDVPDRIRFGRIFEYLDALAGDVAYRHCGGVGEPSSLQQGSHLTIVTAAVDALNLGRDLHMSKDLRLRGYVTHVGRSSMEVRTEVFEGDTYVGDGFFLMVALDKNTQRPTEVPRLIVEEGKGAPIESLAEVLEGAEERSKRRKVQTASALDRNPPLPEEQALVHRIWRATLRGARAPTTIADSGGESGKVAEASETSEGAVCHPEPPSVEVFPFPLSCYGGAPREIGSTRLDSNDLMQADNRNVHGKMFGGYLFRKAFELSWLTAKQFLGTHSPEFLGTDSVFFIKPVEVGAFLHSVARVSFAVPSEVHVRVDLFQVDPSNQTRDLSTSFHFYYGAKRDPETKTTVPPPPVYPRTYGDYMLYLDARRRFKQRS